MTTQAQRLAFDIFEVQLKNGEKVRVNDHVYSAPPWEKREPVPYSIGRILEFLPPETPQEAKTKGKSRNGLDKNLRVRLAWYYRPTDVQDRGSGDHRTLLAAMFSEVVPIVNLRAKCIVRHRDKIQDLPGYKKKDDRFYFSQLFDPFTKETYEVILATEVHNLPAHIKEVLVSRYEYVVCEKEALPDLQDTLRLCETCGDWCPAPESVMCELCKKHYHMYCVNPPLLAKPSRGYGWSCASCNDKRGQGEDATAKARGIKELKRKFKQAPRQYSEEDNDKYWKGWSFRYFGQHTVAEDTLDPDDMIYVRAPTRVGKAHQAVIPALGEPSFVTDDGFTRGDDDTIELLSNVVHMSEELVEKRKAVLSLRKDLQCSVDWLEECIRRMSEAYANRLSFYSVNMKNPLRTRKWRAESRYTDREWNTEESETFDVSVRKHASELRAVKNDLKSRTMPEIVRYFGKWKTQQLKKANEAAAQAALAAPDSSLAPRLLDEEGSVYKPGDRRTFTCGVCRTKESTTWWKAPKALAGGAMCNECGLAWRKYNVRSLKGTEKEKEIEKQRAIERAERAERKAQETPDRESPPVTRSAKLKAEIGSKGGPIPPPMPVPETRAERAERRGENNALTQSSTGKREREGSPLPGPPSKRQRMANGAVPAARLMCSLCKRVGPQGQVVKCATCNFTIHAGCVGVPLEEATADWTCEICTNEESEASNIDTACVVCPKTPADRKRGAKDSAFFRAAKPTENRGWVHILCATFISHLEYSDGRRMRLVEGISAIPKREWTHTCKCCQGGPGCLARCEQCLSVFHPVCAWNHGYRFGLELIPVKGHQKREYPCVEFKGDLGWLSPVILCDNHPTHSRKLYDLCEMDENGKTVLELYNETYKQAQPKEKTYGLLRKARRLDEVVKGPRFDSTPVMDPSLAPPANQKCVHCGTEFSPFWWSVSSAPGIPPRVNGLGGTAEEVEVKVSVTEEDAVMEDHSAPVTNDSLKEITNGMEVDMKLPELDMAGNHPAQCHSCYFKRHQESEQPIVLDLSNPIPVLGA